MKDIFELKFTAHDEIEQLVSLGFDRSDIYKRLKTALRVPAGYEHLARMSTISQVEKAIKVLRYIKGQRKQFLNKTIRV